MNTYKCSLGECHIVVSYGNTALLKTNKEFIVVTNLNNDDGFLSWGNGRYFQSFFPAVKVLEKKVRINKLKGDK